MGAPSDWSKAISSWWYGVIPTVASRSASVGQCGAHLFARNPDDPTQMSVRMSAFDGDPGVRPTWRAFVAYAADWEPIPDDGLERYDEAKPR
jgi:hypothetical protein